MPQKVSLIFQLTTLANDSTVSSQHIAGWSESFWRETPLTTNSPFIRRLATRRSLILASTATIIGWRNSLYTISGNKLLPQGTTVFKARFPGGAANLGDVPQMAIMFSASVNGSPNAVRFNCRGFPDQFVRFGEYEPSGNITLWMKAFTDGLVEDSWRALCRDLSNPSYRVFGIANKVITVEATTGIAVEDYIRLRRVVGTDGYPITGAYRVSAVTPTTVTCPDLSAMDAAGPVGFIRKDAISTRTFNTVNVSRVVVRKVGRPFEQYRGRRSRQRVK